MKSTITTSRGSGFAAGDYVLVHEWKPWWVRLWRWITGYKPPTFTITEVTSETQLTIEDSSR